MEYSEEKILEILEVNGYDEPMKIYPFEEFCDNFEMSLNETLTYHSGYYFSMDEKNEREKCEVHHKRKLYYLEMYLAFTKNPKDFYKAYLTGLYNRISHEYDLIEE